MSNLKLWCLLLSLSIIFGCQSREAPVESPEEVVKKYQEFIDKNAFDEALMISTPAEQERLRELAAFISRVNEEEDELPVMESVFLRSDCREDRDTAWCECLIMDEEGQEFTSQFRLLKVNKRWLMDVPEEETIITEDEIEVIEEILEESFPQQQD